MSNKILRSLAIMGSVILFLIAFYNYYDYLIGVLFAIQPKDGMYVGARTLEEFISLTSASALMYIGLTKVYKKLFLILGVIIGFIALSFLVYPLMMGINFGGQNGQISGALTVLFSIFIFIIGIKFISYGLD